MRVVTMVALLWVMAHAAWAGPAVYVHNRPVPVVWRGSECYVTLDVLRSLLADRKKTVTVDGTGALLVDGKATALMSDGKGGVPLLALARAMGCEVIVNKAAGLIDITTPRGERVANAAKAEPPVDAREKANADRATEQVLKLLGPYSTDEAMGQRVERIGMAIAAKSPRASLHWSFKVLQSKIPNAVSVGMGRIFITTALVAMLDDDELAGALSHEIGHTCLRHTTRVYDQADLYKDYLKRANEAHQRAVRAQAMGEGEMIKIVVADALREEKEYRSKAEGVAKRVQNWTTNDGWDEEYEADRFGMMYAHDAGYRAQGVVDCLARLKSVAGDLTLQQAIDGASTHPPLGVRIEIANKVYSSWYDKRGKPLSKP